MASYPSSVVSLATKVDGVDTYFAAHINALQDEVIALETALLNGVAHTLLPLTDNTYALGSTTKRWSKLWVTDIDGSGALVAAGTTKFGGGPVYTWPAADGTSGQFFKTNGAGVLSWQSITTSLMTGYVTTVADVANTAAADQTTISFTVPANAMADGDVIEIVAAVLSKNNKGSDGVVTHKIFWGSGSVQIGSDSWTNNASERKVLTRFSMMRVGADLWCRKSAVGSVSYDDYDYSLSNHTSFGDNVGVISAPTFSSDQTVALKLTLSAADVNFYWKSQKARAYRVAAS